MADAMDERPGPFSIYGHSGSDPGWLMRWLFAAALERLGRSTDASVMRINSRLKQTTVTTSMLDEWVNGIGSPPADIFGATLLASGADFTPLIESLSADNPARPAFAQGLWGTKTTSRSFAPLRVFLSHTSELRQHPHDRSFVAAAEAAVIRAGHAVSDMAYFSARDSAPAQSCEAMVGRADVYVGIIGERYGAIVQDRPERSYTELEYETASALGLPRLVFLIRENSPFLPPAVQPDEHVLRQETFRRRLQDSDITVAWIDSPPQLEIGVHQTLVELAFGHAASGSDYGDAMGLLQYHGWEMQRRQFLLASGGGLLWLGLSKLPVDRLGLGGTSRPSLSVDALDSYWQVLDQCWALCNNGQLTVVERLLQGLLPELAVHAADRPAAAALASQTMRLLGIVRTHQLRLHDKVSINQQAVEYARLASDPTTLVAALTELAVAFKYAEQPENSFATYLQAIEQADKAAPLVSSRAYAATAAAFAQRSQLAEANRFIGMAYDVFPADPEGEPHWRSADYGIWLLAFYEGLTHLSAGRPVEAELALGAYLRHPMASKAPERNRLEILNQRARAAIMAGELELFTDHLQAAIAGATAIGSRKRLQETLAIYWGETPPGWRAHPLVRQVTERYSTVISQPG